MNRIASMIGRSRRAGRHVVLALGALLAVLVSAGSASAQTGTIPDLSGSITAATTASTALVTQYGPGLIGITLVFLAFMWVWRKIRSAVR
jgi:hypothetical protein